MCYVSHINAIPSEHFYCPRDCNCFFAEINWVTDCSESKLISIPYEELDSIAYVLNMNGNFLRDIEPFPMDVNLRTLLLSDNFLTNIHHSTFAGLQYLMDVDLSSNLISHVDPEAFV